MGKSKKNKKQAGPSAPKTSQQPGASTSAAEEGDCGQCRGIGWLRKDVPIDHPDFGEVFHCWKCGGPKKSGQLGQSSGMGDLKDPPLLAQIVTQGRRGTAAMVKSAREFVNHPEGMRTFWGGCGNGKTTALQACVHELVQRGIPAIYVNGHDLLDHIREAFGGRSGSKGDSPQQRFERYCTVQVLAIDEFDKVHSTGWAEEKLMALIDRRYVLGNESKAGTLIAMNTNPRELRPWIASRLFDGKNRVVHNSDTDIRPALK